MGPELILFPIAYYGSALVGLGLLIGVIVKSSRRLSVVIALLASNVAVWSFLTSPPYWEPVSAGLGFTFAGIFLAVMASVWRMSIWVIRHLRNPAVPTNG